MNRRGQITKIISNLYTVKSDNEYYECRARGKFRNEQITPLVGEFVIFDDETNYILELLERKNELDRPPVANIDIALIMTSVKAPDLSLSLLDKEISCIENAGIKPIICLSKLDLLSFKERKNVLNELKYYKKIGYDVVTNRSIFKIARLLKGQTVVLTGQTGSGKSTFANRFGHLNIETNPISKALGRGVHTTRHAEIYSVRGTNIVDTPGFSALDIKTTKEELKNTFIEFRDSTCKFKECMHDKEPGCDVKNKVEDGTIKKSRYENYLKFRREL